MITLRFLSLRNLAVNQQIAFIATSLVLIFMVWPAPGFVDTILS
jgi:hypothetical protein